jgi:hypothetical protein
MQINAIYEDGAINFITPMRFKHRKFEVVVNIPEIEIEIEEMVQLDKAVTKPAQKNLESSPGVSLLAKIKKILGPDFHPRPAATVEQDKATLLEALEERHSR